MKNLQPIIVFCGRFPGEKAAALFADREAQSFSDVGASAIVIAPRRLGRLSLQKREYRTILLPTLDLSRIPVLWSAANVINQVIFSKMLFLWLLFKKRSGMVIISNEVLPLLFASILTPDIMYEMHDFPERSLWLYRLLFKRARWIVATNQWKADALKERFHIDAKKIIVERNAVDTDVFGSIDKASARATLGIAQNEQLVVYTGHLYDWKGVDTLADAAQLLPEVHFAFVGGTHGDVERFKKDWGTLQNLRIVGHVPHDQVPVWQAAADMLALPNSGKQEISVHYTSPMKLFEYMASNRPIIASDLPSIHEIAEDTISYAQPDNAASFASVIRNAFENMPEAQDRSMKARQLVENHTWDKRSHRLIDALSII